MKRIRSATIDGKRHRIVWRPLLKEENAYGMAWPEALIEIDSSLEDPPLIVEVMIHEFLHKLWPTVEESKIDEWASDITNALQRAELIADEP